MGQAKQRGTRDERVKQSVETKGPKVPRMGAAERRRCIDAAIVEALGKILGKVKS